MPRPRFNDQDKQQLSTWFQRRYEAQFAWKSACSAVMALPGLRGFWPMSSVDYTNPQGTDTSGHGYDLTNNNISLFGYDNLAPYVEFDGVNQYLTKADGGAANWADITGAEAYISAAQRGLAFGGWFYVDTWDAAVTPFMSKWFVANQLSYLLAAVGGGNPRFVITTDGSTQISVTSTVARVTDTWFFMVGRFVPSAELSIFINNTETLLAAGIPATIFDSTSRFSIGEEAADGVFLDGRASMCFLCAAALSDAAIGSLFQQTRAMYGV
jgi:hypothetical protein